MKFKDDLQAARHQLRILKYNRIGVRPRDRAVARADKALHNLEAGEAAILTSLFVENVSLRGLAKTMQCDEAIIQGIRDCALRNFVAELQKVGVIRRTTSEPPDAPMRVDAQRPMTLRQSYSLLGIVEDDPPDFRKAAYRSKMQRHHPDKFHGHGVEAVTLAEARTKRLNQAWEIINRQGHE